MMHRIDGEVAFSISASYGKRLFEPHEAKMVTDSLVVKQRRFKTASNMADVVVTTRVNKRLRCCVRREASIVFGG